MTHFAFNFYCEFWGLDNFFDVDQVLAAVNGLPGINQLKHLLHSVLPAPGGHSDVAQVYVVVLYVVLTLKCPEQS